MILLLKFLLTLKNLLANILLVLALKPLLFCLRFIFYKIITRFYQLYIYLSRKLGWTGRDSKKKLKQFLAWALNQKLTHSLIIITAAAIIFNNLTNEINAQTISNPMGKTILASLIESEFSSLEEGQLVEEFSEEAASPTQQNYFDELMGLKNQPLVETENLEAEEEESAAITQGGTAFVKPEIAAVSGSAGRKETIEYTVEPGDTVSTIAAKFAISVNTILWENNLSAYSLIKPGQKLSILPVSGISYKVTRGDTLLDIAQKYAVEMEKILAANNLNGDQLQVGQKLIIPGGKKTQYASYQPTTYSGVSALKDLFKPSSARPATGNKMNWPTQGYRITQYYSWRHQAVDIANSIGTPIYAADAGVIELIGWSTGYGNNIIINHGGGKKTRYAHMSKFYVSRGEQIDKGDVIGAMGSTGWSTGSHLHFEVIINGVKYNPLNYIK